MKIEGSCDCGQVRYACEADGPVPFMRCYCDFCRKTGSGGYMINLLARADTLEVRGGEHMKIYRASVQAEEASTSRPSRHGRHFCGECGSHLWARNDEWPTLIHPVASSVDTPLPPARATTHIFVRSKPAWIPLIPGPEDKVFDAYPDESIEGWHRRHGLYEG
ncbi:MAG: GFA family protein [Nannocystaceae bacterium]